MNSPKEIANNYIAIGKGKVNTPVAKMFVLGILAGIFIAFGGVASTAAAVSIPLASVGKFLGACIFPGGLTMVLLAGSELFTGNCLLVIPLCKKEITLGGMLKNWVVVFLGNLVGSLIMVGLVFLSNYQGMNGGAVGTTIVSVAAGKMSPDWLTVFAKGIMCNFLGCLAVWIAYGSKTVADKMLGILLPIAAFVACGFEHCVANMFFLPFGILLASAGIAPAGIDPSTVSWAGALWNWSASVPGNIIGGALFVGMAYWIAYHKKEQ